MFQEWRDHDELIEVGVDVRRSGQLGDGAHAVGDQVLADVLGRVAEDDVPPCLSLARLGLPL